MDKSYKINTNYLKQNLTNLVIQSNKILYVLIWDNIYHYAEKQKNSKASAQKLKNGRHAVGGVDGLHLRIVNGSRAWVLRVVVGQRVNEYGELKNIAVILA
jgi:hypothetical protein